MRKQVHHYEFGPDGRAVLTEFTNGERYYKDDVVDALWCEIEYVIPEEGPIITRPRNRICWSTKLIRAGDVPRLCDLGIPENHMVYMSGGEE